MTLISSFIVLWVLIFSLSSQAMPLSPESVKSLRAAGRLEAVVSRVNQARAKGVDAPGPNILKSLPERKRGTPARDETILNVPVILVDFSDNEANENDYPPEHYDEMLFSEGELDPGSMREWYAVNSYGEVDIVGVVVAWVRAPQTYEYYVDGQLGYGDYPQNVQRMVRDAASEADADIDFSDFDNDGDGEVDNLVVVHAGSGAEANGGDSTMIWSHSWALGGFAVRLDGVWINQYTIQPEDGEVGVFGHELGHGLFGLPDLYDRDYSSEGLGEWSMMAGGAWGGGGASPSHLDAWCKYQLGFITPTVVDGDSADVVIPPVENEDAAYILWTQGLVWNEYFIVENRQQIGFDESLPGSGLLIYHIDDDVLDQNDNEWYPGHEDEGHYQVALEQADGDWDLEQNNSRGDGGDPWPGDTNNETLDAESTPDSRDYDGNDTQVAVRNIASDGENVTCDFEVGAGGNVGGEIAYDDGTPVWYIPDENYWSRVTFSAPADLELRGVRFMPYNPTPNFDAPCQIRVYAEDADNNLGDLLWETELQEVPETDVNDWDANWITVEIPQDERINLGNGDNFSIIYGPAPGGDLDLGGIGWWCLMDEGSNVFRSYTYSGDEPAADHAEWFGWDYDLLLRAEVGAQGDAVPDIVVDTDLLFFIDVSVGDSAEQTLTISNVGDGDLTVTDIGIDPDGIFEVVWEGDVVVNAGGELQVGVAFIPEDADLYLATLNIDSDDPDEAQVQVELLGIGVNDAPEVVNPISDVEVEEDWGRYEIARLNDVFSDPNGDSLSFSVSGPEALNMDIWGSDLLYMDPDGDFNGADLEVTVTAEDGRGGLRVLGLALVHPNQARVRRLPESERALRSVNPSETRIDHPSRDETAEDEFLITITPVNDAPVCVDDQGNPLGVALNFNVNEDEELQFILYSRDVDDDADDLEWTMVQRGGLPNGYQFTDNRDGTATFTWQPDYDAGRDAPYTPVIRVNDVAGASDEVTVNIQVDNVNQPPEVVAEIADLELEEDVGRYEIADLDTIFSDPDNDELSFTFGDATGGMMPQWLNMELNGENVLLIQPDTNANHRDYWELIELLARDGEEFVFDYFHLRIDPVNDPPEPFVLLSPADDYQVAYNPDSLGTIDFAWEVAGQNEYEMDTVCYFVWFWAQGNEERVYQVGPLGATEYADLPIQLLADTLELERWQAITFGWEVWAVDSEDSTLCSDAPWTFTIPALGAEADESLPTEFSLGPVYPNPFNAELRIPYTLPQSNLVRVTIYGHTGRMLQQLVSGIQPAGRHIAVWNAGNYPAGVYIVTLQTEIGRWDVKAVLSR